MQLDDYISWYKINLFFLYQEILSTTKHNLARGRKLIDFNVVYNSRIMFYFVVQHDY